MKTHLTDANYSIKWRSPFQFVIGMTKLFRPAALEDAILDLRKYGGKTLPAAMLASAAAIALLILFGKRKAC